MNKNELVASVSEASGLSKVDAAKAVEGVFESITGALKSGGDVRIVGFGTFSVATVPLQQEEIQELEKLFKLKLQSNQSLKPEAH
jgi:nucleoid DNA-binding protein